MTHARNLVILHTPGNEEVSDWVAVRDLIAARAPDIDARIAGNHLRNPSIEEWQASRPSLVFSACPPWRYIARAGKVYAGKPLSKLEENERLVEAGIPTPTTTRLRRGLVLDPDQWGQYLVFKPASGSFGRDVQVVAREEYEPLINDFLDTRDGTFIVQPFIEHTDHRGRPTTHRVLTLFGKALYAIRSSWAEARAPLPDVIRNDGKVAANDATTPRERELLDDEEIIALGELAAGAVPEIPVLGVDIIRETGTGRLYVLELNSAGTVWHFSSGTARERYAASFRKKLYGQFDALNRVAELLVEKTRAEAR